MLTSKKGYSFPLRFDDKKQKNDAKRLAKRDSRSLNKYFLAFVDEQRELNKEYLTSKK